METLSLADLRAEGRIPRLEEVIDFVPNQNGCTVTRVRTRGTRSTAKKTAQKRAAPLEVTSEGKPLFATTPMKKTVSRTPGTGRKRVFKRDEDVRIQVLFDGVKNVYGKDRKLQFAQHAVEEAVEALDRTPDAVVERARTLNLLSEDIYARLKETIC